MQVNGNASIRGVVVGRGGFPNGGDNNNTAVGAQALGSNATGGNNTAIGEAALTNNVTGSQNTAVGSSSQYLLLTGNNNISLGYLSLYGLRGGSNNIAIGSAAGFGSEEPGNVFIGSGSGQNITADNKLSIANSELNNLIYGDFATKQLQVNNSVSPTFLTSSNFIVNGDTYLSDSLRLNTVPTGTAADSVLVIDAVSHAIHKVAQSSLAFNGVLNVANPMNAYSLLLNYFDGDYKPISPVSSPDNGISTALGGTSGTYRPLYNGNISGMGVQINKLNAPMLYNYEYDQLNRLVHMDAWKRTSTAWNALTPTSNYQENISYDPNGNILKYKRNGDSSSAGNDMDKLNYFYTSGTNKLDHITDSVDDARYNTDIDGQSSANYKYDSIGQLISDDQAHITNIRWTVYGKIDSITKAGDTTIKYTYDAGGNRISKTLKHAGNKETTWYVRDAQGNVLSVYTSGDALVNGGNLAQTELHVYGSSRLGIWKRSVDVQSMPSGTTNPFPLSGDSVSLREGPSSLN